MKKLGVIGIAISVMLLVSCGRQQTEAERNADVERQVQERLTAERQAEEQKKLAERVAELEARKNAQPENEAAAPVPQATVQMRAPDIQQRDVADAEPDGDAGERGAASYNTFYTKLEPYGAWRETSDYGYVFQPNEAERSRNWRPYTNGRWVYTDAGWTWDSEEAFGWATYHYGRWTRLGKIGWVWIPGDEWAPAWVSWRKNDDYVGWAPLPPEARFDRSRGIHNWADNDYDIGPEQYCFVPTNDFGEQRIERTIVPVERNVTIVTQTTNVTNITYNNTVIMNQGPNYDELRQRTRQPIQRLRLDRRARFENQNQRAVVRGEVIEMAAPAIAPARPADRPRAVKEKLTQQVVDRGWAGIRDKQAAEKVRAKMKAEAAAPAGSSPKPNVVQAQPQQTPVAPALPTPVRNFPQRAKIPPRPTATATATAMASPNKLQDGQATIEAESRIKEAQQVQKAKQQQKMEALRQAQAAETKLPRATPLAKPTPAPKPSPSVATSAPPAKVTASPANGVSPNEKKNNQEKKKNRRGREEASPSPSPQRE
jgi:uncharacterized protein DUF6600